MNITTAKVEGCNSEGQLDRRLMPMNYPAFSWLVPVMDHRGLCSASLYLSRSNSRVLMRGELRGSKAIAPDVDAQFENGYGRTPGTV